MSNFRKWLTGKEVMKRLNISKMDLFDLVEVGKLQAHDPETGEKVGICREKSLFKNDGFMGPSIRITPSGFEFIDLPKIIRSPDEIEGCYFAVSNVEALKKVPKGNKKKSQAKWDNVRDWVAEKWKEAPDMTIEDMALSDDVTKILGKNYTLKTIRDYIKDLCPNRKPGRRPTSK
jgi:hypothetical protein